MCVLVQTEGGVQRGKASDTHRHKCEERTFRSWVQDLIALSRLN